MVGGCNMGCKIWPRAGRARCDSTAHSTVVLRRYFTRPRSLMPLAERTRINLVADNLYRVF